MINHELNHFCAVFDSFWLFRKSNDVLDQQVCSMRSTSICRNWWTALFDNLARCLPNPSDASVKASVPFNISATLFDDSSYCLSSNLPLKVLDDGIAWAGLGLRRLARFFQADGSALQKAIPVQKKKYATAASFSFKKLLGSLQNCRILQKSFTWRVFMTSYAEKSIISLVENMICNFHSLFLCQSFVRNP